MKPTVNYLSLHAKHFMVSEQTFLAEILFATQLETLKARIIIEAIPRPPWSLTSTFRQSKTLKSVTNRLQTTDRNQLST